MRNAYRILVRKLQRKIQMGEAGVGGWNILAL
jgi:hypothetical protein